MRKKLKTIQGAKLGADSTVANLYLLINDEVQSLKKNSSVGFRAVGLIDLSGGPALQARSSNFELQNRLSILNFTCLAVRCHIPQE
jgi:hypothetical protein